ncbi:MAG: hypothetical protein R3268_00210 [Acidiferrobacterales bacterium]|nr:hypothetical protein [Acidiferrobacterales bacterium]
MRRNEQELDETDLQLIDQYLDRYQMEFEINGDRTALVRALAVSVMNGIPLPHWAEGYWKNACRQYDEGLFATLDEALQLPQRRKPRGDTIRRKRLAKTICPRLREIVEREKCSIENAAMTLEEELSSGGVEISHEAIAKIYYDFRDRSPRIPEANPRIPSLKEI